MPRRSPLPPARASHAAESHAPASRDRHSRTVREFTGLPRRVFDHTGQDDYHDGLTPPKTHRRDADTPPYFTCAAGITSRTQSKVDERPSTYKSEA
jgi:hypothetical protein